MAEGLAVVGLVANIVQLVDFSSKILRRLNEFNSSIEEIPESFHHVKTELPLLQDALQQTKKAIDAGSIGYQDDLVPVVEGCLAQVAQLDGIISITLPASGDDRRTKDMKALISVKQGPRVEHIRRILQGYTLTLTFYYDATASTLRPLTGRYGRQPV